MAAFSLPIDIRLDAFKAHQIFAPHAVTILEAARYYDKHVLAYKNAPIVSDVVQRYVDDGVDRNNRAHTIGDKKHRLNTFAVDFGDSRLCEITREELKEWIQDDGSVVSRLQLMIAKLPLSAQGSSYP